MSNRLAPILDAALLLWLVATLSFFALRLAPGNPALITDPTVPRSQATTLERLYSLDRPLGRQYGSWLTALASGDLGWSIHFRRPVGRIIAEAVPPTLALAGTALCMQYFGSLALALVTSRRRSIRRLLDPFTIVLHAVPTFWLGLLLLRWLGHGWGWFPTFGASAAGSDLRGGLDALHHVFLPAVVLAATNLALPYRLTTASLIGTIDSPLGLAVRARGSSDGQLRWKHALPRALPPLIHRLALDLPVALSGSLILEVVFSRPGLGRVAYVAFQARDFPVLAAVSTAAGALVVAGSLAADLLHRALDPRVSAAGHG